MLRSSDGNLRRIDSARVKSASRRRLAVSSVGIVTYQRMNFGFGGAVLPRYFVDLSRWR